MTTKNKKLSFGKGNAKVGDYVYTFSLPAGHTCPFANECLSRADKKTGKIKDGPQTVFRCFAASMEARMPSVRVSRWNNLDILRAAGLTDSHAMADLILSSIPRMAKKIRIHVAGDFFNPEYLTTFTHSAYLPATLAHLRMSVFRAQTKRRAKLKTDRKPSSAVLLLAWKRACPPLGLAAGIIWTSCVLPD